MKFLDYIQGARKGTGAHRIEHNAMNDPFLSEAIEGYDLVEGNHANRIARMQASVIARTTPQNTGKSAWRIAVAAAAIIALLSGYFALMNHESSMANAHETESSYINLYAPQMYIEQKRMELTAMKENNPSQEANIETAVHISNLDDVLKPVEVLSLYVPSAYAEQKKDEQSQSSSSYEDTKKIFIADASSSILAEAKVPVDQTPQTPQTDQSNKAEQQMPDKLKDAWNTKEVTNLTRRRVVEVNKNNTAPTTTGKNGNVMNVTVAEEPKNSKVKETKATSKIAVDSREARALAEQAGFDKIEEVSADELGGNAMELTETENTKRTISRQSFYRPKVGNSLVSGSTVRTKPEPLIGQKEYKKYLQDSMVRPQDDECKNTKGKVVLRVFIDKDGNPVRVIVTKGLCRTLDKEAVRLVKNGSKWKYGTLPADVEVQF